jgi:hypothetical protein
MISSYSQHNYCDKRKSPDVEAPIKRQRLNDQVENAIDNNIVKGGYIVFDQGNKKEWGEKEAIKDFLKVNKKYKYISINKNRQPDVILKKIS